jgi:hypothetical protein
MRKFVFVIAIFSVLSSLNSSAQAVNYEYVFNKKDTLIKTISFYAALSHQHKDFFYKAFSYQGFETGVIINDKINTGLFVSTFASDLQVKIKSNPMFVTSWKTGITVGNTYSSEKMLHSGWLISAGYFSLKANNKQLDIFSAGKSIISLEGMILEPEVYSEINILKWFKFRAGLAYSFCSFEDHSVVNTDDLNNISVNFSFLVF